MEKLSPYAKRGAIAIVVFSVLFLAVRQFTTLDSMKLSVTGWGWGYFALNVVGLVIIARYLESFFAAFVTGTPLKLPAAAARFLGKVVDSLVVALAFINTAATAPTLCSYSSSTSVIVHFLILGVGLGICEWLGARFVGRRS